MSLKTTVHKLFVARQEAAYNTTFSGTLATKGDFANKPTTTFDVLDLIKLDPSIGSQTDPKVLAETKVNGIIFYFMGGDADLDAFTWKIYGWRNENGPAEIVADGTGVLGSQAVVRYPHNSEIATSKFWADTLVVSNDRWMKKVEATTDGGDSVSKVWFDICGYRYFYVEIPTAVGVMASYVAYW